MKRSIISILISIFITVPIPAPAFAQTVEPTTDTTPAVTQTVHGKKDLKPTLQAEHNSNQLAQLQQKADEMIQNRIDTLNKTLTRISNDKRLSADDKAAFTSEVTSVITELNTLKTKIDADTDVTTARADAKQIVSSYHVYMVLEPQVILLMLIDNLYTLDTRLTTLSSQAQTVINNQKAAGKDTTAEQAALDDAKTQLQTITAKLAADKSTVVGVKLTDASAHATLLAVRKDLATVRQSFAKVRGDFAHLRSDLKETNKSNKNPSGTPTLSPSAEPTTSATPTPTP